ncbi:cytochrome C [Bacillus sp. DNRA2]|uniref:cytochrome c3 family protein n=1 Tax=Bacillus sp. DNRA2 TaxID=2723053 RepID=UPI00145D596F|nr:NapC/NirT family cytochrome c [Bacillus sp. DNRA2]NMD68835.1 cytochrome C [Bacillus sp. DNRA2]
MAFWKRGKKGPSADNPESKKPGLWRRIKNIDWKNPVNRWKLVVVLLFVFIGGISFVGGAIAYTNNPSFCKLCHEMAAEHVTFEKSAHSEQTCVSCHIAPGNVEMVVHKMESLKEVYYHIVGPPDPIVQTVAVLDENCLQCHSMEREVSPNGDLIVAHNDHIKEGISCITCHSGVAHAKVVERGINDSTTYDSWTTANADKLMGSDNMNPNMGTCIDCHKQVNEGKKPWKDPSYALPENPHAEGHGKKEDEKVAKAAEKEKDKDKENQQQLVLKKVSVQKTDVKVSQECSTCHKEVGTPANHTNSDWGQNHGDAAIQTLDQCVNCHSDSKWIKVLGKENIKELLNGTTEKEKYTPNATIVKKEARENPYCSSCHEKRPQSHVDSYTWLTGSHADSARTDEAKAKCFVCHDRDKAIESTKDEGKTENVKAQNDIYCQYCHRTGFKGESL